MHKKVKDLSAKRIKYLIEKEIPFYKWNKTYVDWLKWEIEEAIVEIKDNNSIHLEDELWDVFWTYLCLLHSLEDEWKITSVEKIFERCYNKFGERVWFDWKWWYEWDKVKTKQKEELKKEHDKLYWNK